MWTTMKKGQQLVSYAFSLDPQSEDMWPVGSLTEVLQFCFTLKELSLCRICEVGRLRARTCLPLLKTKDDSQIHVDPMYADCTNATHKHNHGKREIPLCMIIVTTHSWTTPCNNPLKVSRNSVAKLYWLCMRFSLHPTAVNAKVKTHVRIWKC